VDAKSNASTPSPTTHMTSTAASNLVGKRIGMVMFSFYPWDPRPRRIADTLIKAGASIELICLEDEKSPKRSNENGLDITRLGIEHNRGGKLNYAYQYFAFIFLSSLILAWRSLKKRYDLIYVHNMPDVLVACGIIPKLFGAKVILDQHDPMPELMMTIFNMPARSKAVRLICAMEKWSLKRANRVITVNDACKGLFSARGCDERKISVVMNSPNEELFPFREARERVTRSEEGTRRFRVMYHGTIVERNGLDLAVEAVAQVHRSFPDIELNVYGSQTPFLQKVLQRVEELGLKDVIHYRGRKRLEDLGSEIDTCDLGVIPNCRNAFTDINTPTRIFEYLARGKAVVAPQTEGIRDYFTSKSLFFFQSGDSENLAQQIEYVMLHADEAMETVKQGQQVYLAHRWSEEKQTLLQVVDDLLKKRGPR